MLKRAYFRSTSVLIWSYMTCILLIHVTTLLCIGVPYQVSVVAQLSTAGEGKQM